MPDIVITPNGTFDCVFCALDAHYCSGCGTAVTHEQSDRCDMECWAKYLAGDGWLRRCEFPYCAEMTYTQRTSLCWAHLPEIHPDPWVEGGHSE